MPVLPSSGSSILDAQRLRIQAQCDEYATCKADGYHDWAPVTVAAVAEVAA